MKTLTTILFVALSGLLQAQKVRVTAQNALLGVTESSTKVLPSNVLQTFSSGLTRLEGSHYFMKPNAEGIVRLKNSNKTYLFCNMRYNVFNQDLEVTLGGSIRYIKCKDVKSFSLTYKGKQSFFINSEFYTQDVKLKKGYFQIVENGKAQLLRKIFTEIQEANYNIALNVGSKNASLLQKPQYFVIKDKKLEKVRGKRQLVRFFKALGYDAKTVIKQNKLRVRKDKDLRKLIQLYNQTQKKD